MSVSKTVNDVQIMTLEYAIDIARVCDSIPEFIKYMEKRLEKVRENK